MQRSAEPTSTRTTRAHDWRAYLDATSDEDAEQPVRSTYVDAHGRRQVATIYPTPPNRKE